MMNTFGKGLVLIQTMLSVAALVWAFLLFFQGRDLGFAEPRKEVMEYDKEGNPKPNSTIRFPSEIDKSTVALIAARNTRDQLFVHVQPALDNLRKTEPYLPNNHLAYQRLLKRMREAPEIIEVKRLKEGGFFVEIEKGDLGQPVQEDKAVDGVSKSYKAYAAELAKYIGHVKPDTKEFVPGDLGKVEAELRVVAADIKKFTAELTGTDEANKYLYPGLYQLTDMEFKAQGQLKIEIDEIKPHWSKAIEQARLYLFRRSDLEATLSKLQAPPPKIQKKQ
jgi:hypothetical protein